MHGMPTYGLFHLWVEQGTFPFNVNKLRSHSLKDIVAFFLHAFLGGDHLLHNSNVKQILETLICTGRKMVDNVPQRSQGFCMTKSCFDNHKADDAFGA